MTFENIAAAFASGQLSWREEPRLREQDWGHIRTLEECAHTVLHRDTFGTFYYRIPDGESAADVYDRVSDFFGTLYRDFAKPSLPDNVLLVTHGITLRLFLTRWFHWTVEQSEAVANPEIVR
jgi:broad specificity phosphatase PhoE